MNPTKIEWCDFSSNPIYATVDGKRGWFCEKVSPGCAHCYSSTMNEGRFGNGLEFLPSNRERVEFVLNEKELAEWSKPKYRGKRVFAFDMTDLFGEWVSDEWLDKIFDAIEVAVCMILTLAKRPERQRDYIKRRYANRKPPEQWHAGITVENQRWADERIPILLDTPAAVRFLSCEPLLGPIDIGLNRWMRVNRQLRSHPLAGNQLLVRPGTYRATSNRNGALAVDGLGIMPDEFSRLPMLSWVICGGESGSRHRPFDIDWARSLRDQCADAGVAYFCKQLGGIRPGNKLEDLPEDLRVREFPR